MAEIVIDIRSNNAESRLSSLRTSFERTDRSIDSTTQSVGVLNKGIVGLVGAIGGLYGVKSAFDSIQTGFKTLETASLEVSKTTGLVGDDLKRLTDELDTMSTTMGGFEVKGLYAIAESAGQLGIKGVDNLKTFTKEMQYMASSSKLTSEEASTGFAEIANALNLPISDINKLTSSFSKLASTTTADEAKLLDFTQRLAGAGKTLGLTNAEIVAVGATMKDVGVNVEVGGTAMSQVFAKMIKDTESFAKVSHVEFSEYSKLIDDKPIKALELFLSSLGEMDKKAKIKVLDDMKLSGSGLSSTLLKLSTNTEKLTANVKTSSDAYIYGKATQDEYRVASESLVNQQAKAQSSMMLLQRTIGEQMKPIMLEYNDLVINVSNSLNSFFQRNEDDISDWGSLVRYSFSEVGSAFFTVGEIAFEIFKSIGKLIIGVLPSFSLFEGKTNDNVATVAKLSGYVKALGMVIENFGAVLSVSSVGFEMFGKAIAHGAIKQLSLLQAKYYGVMATINEGLSMVGLDDNNDSQRYRTLEAKARASVANSEVSLNREMNRLIKERDKALSKIHSATEIHNASKVKALKVDKKINDRNAKKYEKMFKDFDKSTLKTKKLTEETKKLSKALTLPMNNTLSANSASKALSNNTITSHTNSRYSKNNTISKNVTLENHIAEIEAFDRKYKQSTLSNFEYKKQQLEKEKKEYMSLNIDKNKIDKWFNSEYGKLLKTKTDKEDKAREEAQKKIEDARKAEYNEWQKESNERQKQLDEEYNAKLKVAEILGDKYFLKKAKIEKQIFELQPYISDEELRRVRARLESSLKDIGIDLSGMFKNIFSSGNIGDSIQGMLDGFTKHTLDDFADTLSNKIGDAMSKGFKTDDFKIFSNDGSLSEFGQQGAMAGASILGDLLNSGKRNSTEDEGAKIGQAIGASVGTALGGQLGGAIVGAYGEFWGGTVAGALFGGEKTRYIDVAEDGTATAKKHRSGGILRGGKTTVLDEETKQMNDSLKKAYAQYGDLLEFIKPTFDGILQLDSGRYKTADEIFNEALPKEFFDAWTNTIRTDVEQGLASAFNPTTTYAVSDELYREWKAYAESKDQKINEALFEVLGNLKGKSVSVKEFNLRDNEEALLEYRNSILAEQEAKLEEELKLGDITLQNYDDKMRELTAHGATAEDINSFTALGDVLMAQQQNVDALTEAEKNRAEAIKNAQKELTDSIYNIKTSYKDWYNTKDMSEGQKYSYTLMRAREEQERYATLLGESSITTENYLDRFSQAIKKGVDKEALDNWEQLGQSIENVVNLQMQKVNEIDNFIASSAMGNISYLNMFEKSFEAKRRFDNEMNVSNANSYLDSVKKTSISRFDYKIKYDDTMRSLKDSVKVEKVMTVKNPENDKKIEELGSKIDKLVQSTENASKAEVEELKNMVDELKKSIKENAKGFENVAHATERAGYQSA